MNIESIASDRIREFLIKFVSYGKRKVAVDIHELSLIELIFSHDQPSSWMLVEAIAVDINIQIGKINRWKEIKSDDEINLMYIQWMASVTSQFDNPFYYTMQKLYEMPIAKMSDIGSASVNNLKNIKDSNLLEQDMRVALEELIEMVEKENFQTILAKQSDLSPLAILLEMNREQMVELSFEEQVKWFGKAMLKDYFNLLLSQDIADEIKNPSKVSMPAISKIEWLGTQKELGELFVELERKKFISEVTPTMKKTISLIFDKAKSISQVMKPTEAIPGEKTYDGIYTKGYRPIFSKISANRKYK